MCVWGTGDDAFASRPELNATQFVRGESRTKMQELFVVANVESA